MPRNNNTPPDPERQLMIKTKTCQRLLKEYNYYKNEVKENEIKLEEMKVQNQDPYDIKRYEQILGESNMMVPDSYKRLQQSLNDLLNFINNTNNELNDSSNNEWMIIAKSILADQQIIISKEDVVKTQDEENVSTDNIVIETNVDDLKDGEAF